MCIVYFRFVQHHVFFAYRLAFSAITRNIMTLNLLYTKIFNYLVFRNMLNFIHTKIFTYTVGKHNGHDTLVCVIFSRAVHMNLCLVIPSN